MKIIVTEETAAPGDPKPGANKPQRQQPEKARGSSHGAGLDSAPPTRNGQMQAARQAQRPQEKHGRGQANGFVQDKIERLPQVEASCVLEGPEENPEKKVAQGPMMREIENLVREANGLETLQPIEEPVAEVEALVAEALEGEFDSEAGDDEQKE